MLLFSDITRCWVLPRGEDGLVVVLEDGVLLRTLAKLYIILFSCGLFNDAVSSSVGLNGRLANEY
jgi:hypothetical protein